jgi:hypothetical protein
MATDGKECAENHPCFHHEFGDKAFKKTAVNK